MKQAKRNRPLRLLSLGLALSVFALPLAGCKTEEQIQQQQAPVQNVTDILAVDLRNTLQVNGMGKVLVTPDTARVWFTVEAEMEEAAAAQQANAEATALVLEAIQKAGVAEGDIETGSLSIRDQYDYSKEPAEVTGYRASCTLTVTVRDMDKLGKVITTAVAAGATGLQGPEFSISDTTQGYARALEAAMADAQAKAEALAASAGAQLSPLPMSIEETSANRGVEALSFDAAERAVAAAPAEPENGMDAPIAISDLEVTASVRLVYEIAQP